MKLRNILLVAILGVALVGITSCGGKAEKSNTVEVAASDVPQQYLLNPDSCLSVSILRGADDKVAMSEEDSKIVLAYLNSGVYDKERNDSGILFKMVSPDYTFLISYKTGEESMVQYWSELSLISLNAKWYLPISAANIQDTLAKYSK